MRQVTLEHFCDILEIMSIDRSVKSGFAVTHFGHIEGRRTVAISTGRGEGDCYILQ